LIANFWKYVPTAHGVHAALAFAASWPSGHRHVDAPAEENLSAAHGTHVSSAVAPVVCENLPARQSMQASEPVSVLYLPATQAVHGLPVKPALH